MRHLAVLLPDVALLILICRMAFVGLHHTRPALFVFLCAWLAFSVATLILSQALPNDSPRYADFYFRLTFLACIFAIPAAWRAMFQLLRGPIAPILVVALWFLAARLVHEVLRREPPTVALLAFLSTSFLAACIGGLLGLAAVASRGLAALPGPTGAGTTGAAGWQLEAGVGGCLYLFGAGLLALRVLSASPVAWHLLAVAVMVVWLLLAAYVGPKPDALVSFEKLALVPAAFLRPRFISTWRSDHD